MESNKKTYLLLIIMGLIWLLFVIVGRMLLG